MAHPDGEGATPATERPLTPTERYAIASIARERRRDDKAAPDPQAGDPEVRAMVSLVRYVVGGLVAVVLAAFLLFAALASARLDLLGIGSAGAPATGAP